MLYLNAYLSSKSYGGPEEGGWYYNVRVWQACIPIATEYQSGKEYFFQNGEIVIQDCRYCYGSGEVLDDNDPCTIPCVECGEVPANKVEVENKIAELRLLLEHELIIGQREELVILLENKQAENYPNRKPLYE